MSDAARPAGTGRIRAMRRHVVVGGLGAVFVVVVMALTGFSSETWGMPDSRKADGWVWRLNVATGTLALVLIVATLAYRPVRILSGRTAGPAHLPWRRTIGIWASIAVVVHVPGGISVHTSGWRFWTPFESIVPGVDSRPFDEFTIGYWMGVFALLAMVPLVVTSNDRAMRRLGARRWQRWHRVAVWTTYWLTAVHVVTLQYGEDRDLRHVALTASVFAVALAARILGRRSPTPSPA